MAAKDTRRSRKDKRSSVPQEPNVPTSQVLTAEGELSSLNVRGRPDLTALKLFILNRAGDRFQHHDCWLKQFGRKKAKRLMEEGQFVPGANGHHFQVNIGNSHLRAILLGADPRAQRWTGFALGEDGCWRWHSWIVRSKDHRLIETTVDRFILYFGVREPVPARYTKVYAKLDIANVPQYKALFEGPLPTRTLNYPSK